MFFRLCLAVLFFSAPAGYCQLFDLKCLALDVVQKVFTPQTLPDYPQTPLKNTDINSYANSVLAKLSPYAKNKNMDVLILQTAKVNGFCNGSQIQITRGLLDMMKNEAELACLIGHEVGHIDLGHLNKVYKPDYMNTAQGAGILLLGQVTGQADVAQTANNAHNNMVVANYGQELEEAADEYGAELAAKAGYDPYAFVDLFDRLAQKRGKDMAVKINGLTEGHKTSDARAQHLLDYLNAKGYKPGEGFKKAKEFRLAMADLKNIKTGEGGKNDVFPRVTDDEKKDIQTLQKTNDELAAADKGGQKLTRPQFLKAMKSYSDYVRKYKISRSQLVAELKTEASSPPVKNFMDDNLTQDDPLFDQQDPNGLGPASKELIQGLELVAHVGLAIAAPEVMVPVMAYEAIAGQDFFTGQNLNSGQRALSALGAIIPGAAQEEELVESLEQMAAGDKTAAQAIETGAQDLKNAEQSPTLNKTLENPNFQTSDFVVRDDGSIIPANGYRYIDSNNPNLSSYLKSGEIPANAKGTYVSFDKFDNMDTASGNLQTQGFNDARYRINFDTEQTANSLKIPNGKWGTAEWLEPITKDYPDYGPGGATQAITNSPIKIKNIVDLKTGQVLYGK
jgi:Zn-dependent protease with chaperone function